MFQQWFDDLARAAAGGKSRRQALKQIGGVVGAVVVAALPGQVLAAGGGNSACAQVCAQVFGADTPAADACASQAAHGQGLCYQCGPAAGNTGLTLCGGTCVNTSTDVNNCGACGKACTAPANATASCTNGTCAYTCNTGYKPCGGACIPLAHCCTDADCGTGKTCASGVCFTICNFAGSGCPNGCAPVCFGSVQGTGQYVCANIKSTSGCPCPEGQACQDGFICLAPC